MQKIVINKKHGGFGLSYEALELLAKKKGVELAARKYGYVIVKDGKETGDFFYESNFSRDDPDLVAVVEELGDKANDMFSKLKIVEIPDGVNWIIDEYNGWESIHETHRIWD